LGRSEPAASGEEKGKLKRLMADLSLEKRILSVLSRGKTSSRRDLGGWSNGC
jgi:hypothetical protein